MSNRDYYYKQRKLAFELYEEGRYSEAEFMLLKFAKHEDWKAEYYLGKIAERNNNIEEAKKWYRIAGQQDELPFYKFDVLEAGGIIALANEDVFMKNKNAAEKGDVEAQFTLGLFYDKGFYVREDIEQASSWYRKAAERGHAKAQCIYGMILEDIKRNFRDAQVFYQKAAEQGVFEAFLNMSYYYYRTKDYMSEHQCNLKAAEGNLVYAFNNLGFDYEDGIGVTKDKNKALKYYQMAAEKGVAESQISIGYLYDFGNGVEKNDEKAFEWYLKAAENGDVEASGDVGERYLEGRGVDKNRDEGIKWLVIAAKRGNAYIEENYYHYIEKYLTYELD